MAPRRKEVEAEPPASIPAEDVQMEEVPAESEGEILMREDPHNPAAMMFQEQRLRILPGSTDKAASFEFKKEDHTLGNALRYIIMKNPDVEFCGYSIPHPSEELMNVRIQTYDYSAEDALRKGLDDLIDLCDVVADKFTEAREAHASKMEA
ncbi:023de10c-8b1f-4439-b1da-159d4208a37b [Sclerotinia trifoliorum]|uniref:DNA-directed RNA polymerases I and III subunit RPAC2 n=1 Tax=Sclerotinia trifoliorum TaxID=28548 RepID=A0A8H2VLX2_9HELO|nr:023de10c-8b1f-4439-b1da-159d4208a37b [Sclerotinia trifoliorum]